MAELSNTIIYGSLTVTKDLTVVNGIPASDVVVTPAGGISSTNVQAAIEELDSEKASSSHNHTLDGLSNTTITSNSSGEILKWNGSAWINNTLAEAGIAAASHAHGSITNDGKIGSTANLPIITSTAGALAAGSFGTAANSFCQGNDSRLSNARTPTSHNNTYHSTSYVSNVVVKSYKEHTFSVKGVIKVTSTDDEYIPGFYVYIPTNTSKKIVRVYGILKAGTSANVTLMKNGTDITSPDYDNFTVGTTKTTVTGDVTLASEDLIVLKVDSVSGTPKGLTVTVVIEETCLTTLTT